MRVCFHDIHDLSLGLYFDRILEVTNRALPDNNEFNINDVIEFHNITKYIENDIYHKNWDKEITNNLKSLLGMYKKIIGIFYSKIDNQNIDHFYSTIECNKYIEDFWKLFDFYKLYNKISEDVFYEIFQKFDPYIDYILRNRKIVDTYSKSIRDLILSDPNNIRLFLEKYELYELLERYDEIFLPKSLTLEDKEKLIIEYIESENPNYNYLELLTTLKNDKDCIIINDKTRLLAIKKKELISLDFFSSDNSINIKTSVVFKDQDEEVISYLDIENQNYSYSISWILNNRDFNTLLNNFIYLFNYCDQQNRISLVSKISELSVLEKIQITSKHSYKYGLDFYLKNTLSNLQMKSYYFFLKHNNIYLESIIEWFFKDYIYEEFGVRNFGFTPISQSLTFFEKSRTVLPEIDSILKQYNLFVEDQEIDHELLQITSEHLLIKNVASLIPDKYVYSNDSEEYIRVVYYMFSDQCLLNYIEGKDYQYDNFFKLLIYENICIEDYEEYRKYEINWLIENNYVKIVNNFLKIENMIRMNIFYDLYLNNVISYHNCNQSKQEEIDKLVKSKLLKFESSLFSKPEQDYINFHLNKTFNNSLDIRNSYLHGTQARNDQEGVHQDNYFIILKILILIIIKINDDLCIKSKFLD